MELVMGNRGVTPQTAAKIIKRKTVDIRPIK